MKSLILGTILIHCATALPLLAQNLDYECEVAYPEANPRLHVKIVLADDQKKQIDYFSRVTREALRVVEDIFKIPFRDDFSIVFDSRYDFHNGLATVVPTNRIFVHTEAPQLESSIGIVREPHFETAVHELAHMIMLQQRRGVFVPLSWIFGNVSRPNMLFPRWLHEGMAVWAESHVGGRGTSGIIDSEIRKYAEYYQRTKRHPLRNDLLDGSLELNATRSGDMPYHFGYLMVEDLMKSENSQSAGELMKRSSSWPGWFFHRLYRMNGKVMSDRFRSLRETWAQKPLVSVGKREIASDEKSISGPFVSHPGLSWIFLRDQKKFLESPKVVLHYESPGIAPIETEFSRASTRIHSAHWSPPLQAWVLLASWAVHNSNLRKEKKILLLNNRGKILCESEAVSRLREITVDGKSLAWIRSDAEGYFYFERAEISRRCQLKRPALILKTPAPFERLSHPWIKKEDWLVARSEGRDMSRDYIQGRDFEFKAKSGALGFPHFVVKDGKQQLFLTWYKKDYRGPALAQADSNELKIYPVVTEAPRNYALGDSIYSLTSFWDKDRIEKIPMGESPIPDSGSIKSESAVPLSKTQKDIPELSPVESESNETPTQRYGAWPSLWPHFWFPSVETYDRGTSISGSTFFQDLSGNWRGSTLLGFDTGASRPQGSLLLERVHMGFGMFDESSLQAISNFRYVGTEIQDIQIATLRFRLSQRLNSRFHFYASPGLDYRRGSKTRYLTSYSIGAPALSVGFYSPHAIQVHAGAYQITQFSDALYLSMNARWLPEPSFEAYGNFQGKLARLGYLLGLEYGKSSPASFPKSYYEWGGRPAFSTLDTGYLARGFPTSIGPALQILRGHAEFGFKLWSPQRGLAWNRMHLGNVELRPLYEVVTSDLYIPTLSGPPRRSTITRMSKKYFHTVGAEVDVFFQALHYADFKASFGYFHGFGPLGEDHIGLKLVTLTDFF